MLYYRRSSPTTSQTRARAAASTARGLFPCFIAEPGPAKVVTPAAFFFEILPRLAKAGRLRKTLGRPDAKVPRAARR